MRYGAKARENVKAEVRRNGKGEMNTIGISMVEVRKRERARAEAKTRVA